MKNIAKLSVSVIGAQLIGLLGTPFTIKAIPSWYSTLDKPFFAPPNWLFAPAWTLLYTLIGISFFLLWQQGWKKKQVMTARNYFFAQLALNGIWSPIFFGLRSPLLGLIVIIAMWIMIVLTINKMYNVSKWASYLLIPYLLWVSFATLLNATIYLLN